MCNDALALELGLDPQWLRSDPGIDFLLGASGGVAQAYAGHQFGTFSPLLGDGRALLLGETTGQRVVDVHLKGSGPTVFARAGDGRATLDAMLREYLLSEAMHALGVPTTRSLAVLTTGHQVARATPTPGLHQGAVLVRTATSHLRIGTFEYAASLGTDVLRRLTDHALERHVPTATSPRALLEHVVRAQAQLVASWMLLGFVHGVMNTDNTTISGETIDYGPCAFLDAFNPASVFSSIDVNGRYAYAQQPAAAAWNLTRLAEALLPILDPDLTVAVTIAEEVLNEFTAHYYAAWLSGARAKLGVVPALGAVEDTTLITDFLNLLRVSRADMTSVFASLVPASQGDDAPLRSLLRDDHATRTSLDAWLASWRNRHPDPDALSATNPVRIPRNHLVEEALAHGASGELHPFEQLLDAVTHPYGARPGRERYARPSTSSAPYVTYCGT